jgi:hypothetical protein
LAIPIREVKHELRHYGINIEAIFEKEQLYMKLIQARERKSQLMKEKAEAEQKTLNEENKKEETKDRIIKEVSKWSKQKTVQIMLNEIMGYTSSKHEKYLRRTSTLAVVSKAYKLSLLKIHPDKHMGDWAQHIRATEMFKYVSTSFNAFRKTHGG